MLKFKDKIAELVSTCIFIGNSKYAPGTLGSLLVFPIYYPIMKYLENTFLIFLILTIFVFVIGTYCVSIYEKRFQTKDHRSIIIDEVFGQLTILLFSYNYFDYLNARHTKELAIILVFVTSFILFRFFDITKIFPIFLFEKLPGAWGIMLDDFIAGLIGGIILYGITLII